MSITSTHLVVLPDIRPDRAPLQVEEISGNSGTKGCPPKPEIPRRNPSRCPTRTPPPRDDHDIQDPNLPPSRPGSPSSAPSTVTLSVIPLSSVAENVGDFTGDPLVAEPEPLGRKHGEVWLAPCPVTFLTGMRYSRREKLYVMLTSLLRAAHPRISYIIISSRHYSKEDVIKKVPPMNDIEPRLVSIMKALICTGKLASQTPLDPKGLDLWAGNRMSTRRGRCISVHRYVAIPHLT